MNLNLKQYILQLQNIDDMIKNTQFNNDLDKRIVLELINTCFNYINYIENTLEVIKKIENNNNTVDYTKVGNTADLTDEEIYTLKNMMKYSTNYNNNLLVLVTENYRNFHVSSFTYEFNKLTLQEMINKKISLFNSRIKLIFKIFKNEKLTQQESKTVYDIKRKITKNDTEHNV